jgi:signal recognition particle receptor subunit beta
MNNLLERPQQPVVVNVVYDGPPEAGKTTSVRALARSFGREVYTPEEQSGRTVYFDWLVHTGGRFDGAPICCQIASVPGQTRWSARRRRLLEGADAVVFVGDTSAGGWQLTLERLEKLRADLDARDGVPVGIVFQANRRDVPTSIPIDEVRARVGNARIAIVESVATDGTGVREAFVFAVRLALDRVRELPPGERPGQEKLRDPRAELEFLKGLDTGVVDTRRPPPSGGGAAHRPPSHEVPSGLVWPPVEGRIVLRQAVGAATALDVEEVGDELVVSNREFVLRSEREALFTDLETGRQQLIEWARLHAGAQPLLSPARCIVLAETSDRSFRLWQVVRREPSLRQAFAEGTGSGEATHLALSLANLSRLLSEAGYLCAATALALPCSLDTLGASELNRPRYIGTMPRRPTSCSDTPASAEFVAGELLSLLLERSPRERAEVGSAIRRTPAAAFGAANGARIREMLAESLAS